MSGRSPRFISLGWDEYTVSISGKFHSTYAYVQVGDTQHTAAADIQVARDTLICIVVDGSSTANKEKCDVTLNGATVLSGAGRYFLNVKAPTTIVFTKGSSAWYTCAITTG